MGDMWGRVKSGFRIKELMFKVRKGLNMITN